MMIIYSLFVMTILQMIQFFFTTMSIFSKNMKKMYVYERQELKYFTTMSIFS